MTPRTGPWAGTPRRGWLLTEAESADPVLRRAVYADAGRAWVMVCPAWFAGPVALVSELAADVASGTSDAADVLEALASIAADLHALAVGYAGALDADLTDEHIAADVAAFIAGVVGEPDPRQLLPAWGAVLAAAAGAT